MALLYEMTGCEPCAVTVVERHAAGFKTGNNTVDNHHPRHLFHQMDQLGVGDHFCMDHQRRTAMTDQLLNGLALFLFIVVAITNQQEISGVIRDLFYGFDHCTEKRIGYIPDHQPDGFCRLLGKGARVGVRVIIQVFHGVLHGLARCITRFRGVVDHAGDGRDGNTGQTSHILNCRHSIPSYRGKRLHTN